MISIGPLFIMFVIHWELVKWTRRFLLVTVAALWLRIEARKLQEIILSQFAPSLEKFMTRNKQSAPDMISIGPLFIILVIHWELVSWTSRFLLVNVAALWLI
jgi:hypothetical protein